MAEKLPPSQLLALEWLRRRGGDAVFTKHGTVLGQGEIAPYMRRTWNRLRDAGLIQFYGGPKGRSRLRIVAKTINPHGQ